MQCVLAQAARELDEALRADAVGLAAALHAERDRVADVQLPARARAEYHLVEVVRPRRGHGPRGSCLAATYRRKERTPINRRIYWPKAVRSGGGSTPVA